VEGLNMNRTVVIAVLAGLVAGFVGALGGGVAFVGLRSDPPLKAVTGAQLPDPVPAVKQEVPPPIAPAEPPKPKPAATAAEAVRRAVAELRDSAKLLPADQAAVVFRAADAANASIASPAPQGKRSAIEVIPRPADITRAEKGVIYFGNAKVGLTGQLGDGAWIREIIDEKTAIVRVLHSAIYDTTGRRLTDSSYYAFVAQNFPTVGFVDKAMIEGERFQKWVIVGTTKYQGETLWVVEPFEKAK
jgi:hypothetical protein